MSWKNENQVWADLFVLLSRGLAYWNIANWQLARKYQPTKGNFQPPMLLLHLLNTRPVGTVQQRYKARQGNLEKENTQLEEWTFQIDAVKPRKPGLVQEETSLDVLSKLRAWLNGPEGVKEIWDLGYNSLLVNISQVPPFLTDNDVFEMHPNLELHLFLQQSDTRSTPSATRWEGNIKGV